MKRKNVLALIALVMVFALALTGCGKDDTPAEPDVLDQTWALSDWDLTATAWSSNNGANVVLTATPENHYKNVEASFVIRLEGEDVKSVPCEWDGNAYTATVDLNAADGYCYYLVMCDADGTQTVEFEVNTPGNPSNGKLINMEHSLEAYCHLSVTDSKLDGNRLTVTGGNAEIHLPLISQDGNPVAYNSASLVLSFAGEEVARQELTLPESQAEGIYEMDIKDITFDIPNMEDDQQLELKLEVSLADGQIFDAPGITWIYFDGQLLSAIG